MASDPPTSGPPIRLAIVTPVFNDWTAFARLAEELDSSAASWGVEASVVAVDDGSTEQRAPPALPEPRHLRRIELLQLPCNLGHQRAIAVGICDVASRKAFDVVVVMDSDGEDRPEDVGRLLEEHRKAPGSIVIARRARRSEGLAFRVLYRLYRVLFQLLTGSAIDFGNFSLLPAARLGGLVYVPELWNHLAATIVRSRVPLVRVSTGRGVRYAGHSTMNLFSLVRHGMSAISVFADVLFVRMLVFSGAASVAALTVGAVATVLRLFTSLATPGWASTVVGVSAVMLFQSLTLFAVGAFMMLASRSTFAFVPALHALQYVGERRLLAERSRAYAQGEIAVGSSR